MTRAHDSIDHDSIDHDSVDHVHWQERRLGLDDWTGPHPVHQDPSSAPVAPHLLPETARVTLDGHLSVGGVDVLDVVEDVGTPVFLYDEAHLRARCREAYRAFGEGVAYASKAFLNRSMATLVNEEGLMLDVASGGELYAALRAGVPADRLVLHGSNKASSELALGVDVGRIVVDSFDEIGRLERLMAGRARASRPRALVRINPGVEAHTHPSVTTGQEDSKFGFSLGSGAAAEAVARLTRPHSPVELVGLHVHVGSMVLDLSTVEDAIRSVADLLGASGLRELCVGGGLGVAYTGDTPAAPSITEWAAAVHRACRAAGVAEAVRITAEPGRAIAAAAGITCYTVGTVKAVGLSTSPWSRTYVSVDGGMSDNPRPALYGSRYEAFLPGRVAAARPLAVRVTGKHCESGDILVRSGHLPADTSVGDVLATPVTGAYCYAMASNYNKVPRPPVVFLRDGRSRVVTRRESFEDLLRLDV